MEIIKDLFIGILFVIKIICIVRLLFILAFLEQIIYRQVRKALEETHV